MPGQQQFTTASPTQPPAPRYSRVEDAARKQLAESTASITKVQQFLDTWEDKRAHFLASWDEKRQQSQRRLADAQKDAAEAQQVLDRKAAQGTAAAAEQPSAHQDMAMPMP